ncbi:hypothetical protein [Mucilaginibacter sp. PPCGB 2223]|nr:hypothetical protein [Mucilaginibacter sp. PPCGB 2223]
MKHVLKTRKTNEKINPYPFLILAVLILLIIFIVFHLIFKNQVF